jgi:hypothetical protein
VLSHGHIEPQSCAHCKHRQSTWIQCLECDFRVCDACYSNRPSTTTTTTPSPSPLPSTLEHSHNAIVHDEAHVTIRLRAAKYGLFYRTGDVFDPECPFDDVTLAPTEDSEYVLAPTRCINDLPSEAYCSTVVPSATTAASSSGTAYSSYIPSSLSTSSNPYDLIDAESDECTNASAYSSGIAEQQHLYQADPSTMKEPYGMQHHNANHASDSYGSLDSQSLKPNTTAAGAPPSYGSLGTCAASASVYGSLGASNDSASAYGSLTSGATNAATEPNAYSLGFGEQALRRNTGASAYSGSLPAASADASATDVSTTHSWHESNNWNERFQQVAETHANTLEEKIAKWQKLLSLTESFEKVATALGKQIIMERNVPLSQRSIKPLNVGGQAGGEKYLKDGVFFKVCVCESERDLLATKRVFD